MFRSCNTVFYILPHSIRTYFFDHEKVVQLDLPENIINNLEVTDQIGFEKLLESFIQTNKLNHRKIIILLSDKVYFEKKFAINEIKNNSNIIEDFYSKIPFFPDITAKKKVFTDTRDVLLYVTNHIIYDTIYKVSKKYHSEIIGVYPIAAFPKLTEKDIKASIISREIRNMIITIKKYDFLLKDEINQPFHKLKRNLIIFSTLCAILFCLIAYIFQIQKLVRRQNTRTNNNVIPRLKITPTIKIVNKKQYSLSLLNGSGKAGRAGDLKKIMEEEGFSVKSIGDADNGDYNNTTISSTGKIDEEFMSELIIALEKQYVVDQKIGKLSDTSSADIVVIIGKQ